MGCSNTKPLSAASAQDNSPAPNPPTPANSSDPPTVVVDGGQTTATDVAVNGDSGGPSTETKATAPNPFGDVKSVHLEDPVVGSVISHAVEPVVEDPIAEEAEAADILKVEEEADDEADKTEAEGEILEDPDAICPMDTSGELPDTEAETKEAVDDSANTEDAEEAPTTEEINEEENKDAENEGESPEVVEDNDGNEPSED